MAVWFVRTGGSDLNSGGGDADSANITGDSGTPFVVTGGTTLTYAPGGFNSLPADSTTYTRSVNLQIAGVSTIRKITVTGDTTATLSASVANASYNGRVGGARPGIHKSVGTGSGENAALASSDVVTLEEGATFTETTIVVDQVIYLRGRGATIDGTGGGAGSDILTNNTAIAGAVSDLILANAVDIGRAGAQGGTPSKVRAQSCGGNGFTLGAIVGVSYLSARACGGTGILMGGNNPLSSLFHCEAGDCTGYGITATRGGSLVDCLVYDNGGGGANMVSDSGMTIRAVNCTFEGNTGTGVNLPNVVAGGTVVLANCLITNNTTGASAASDISGVQVFVDFNLYNGNGTPRTNVPVGANDLTDDPEYTAAASDDYSIKTTGAAYRAGYSPFKNPTLNALHLGAVPSPGSGESVGGSGGGSCLIGLRMTT